MMMVILATRGQSDMTEQTKEGGQPIAYRAVITAMPEVSRVIYKLHIDLLPITCSLEDGRRGYVPRR